MRKKDKPKFKLIVLLTEEQKVLIKAGLKDIGAKRLISDKQLNAEEDKWLRS